MSDRLELAQGGRRSLEFRVKNMPSGDQVVKAREWRDYLVWE